MQLNFIKCSSSVNSEVFRSCHAWTSSSLQWLVLFTAGMRNAASRRLSTAHHLHTSHGVSLAILLIARIYFAFWNMPIVHLRAVSDQIYGSATGFQCIVGNIVSRAVCRGRLLSLCKLWNPEAKTEVCAESICWILSVASWNPACQFWGGCCFTLSSAQVEIHLNEARERDKKHMHVQTYSMNIRACLYKMIIKLLTVVPCILIFQNESRLLEMDKKRLALCYEKSNTVVLEYIPKYRGIILFIYHDILWQKKNGICK